MVVLGVAGDVELGEAWGCGAVLVGGATAPVGGFTDGDVCGAVAELPTCGVAAPRDCATLQLAQASVNDKTANPVFDILISG